MINDEKQCCGNCMYFIRNQAEPNVHICVSMYSKMCGKEVTKDGMCYSWRPIPPSRQKKRKK